MRKIIMQQVYDTDTAELLMSKHWRTYHPNQGGGSPMLDHERDLYRTKKGAFFAYIRDDKGYGRNRDGATGLYTDTVRRIEVFRSEIEASVWCEEENFEATDVEKHFKIEEA